MHIYICVYIYICIYKCVYIYICIYVYIYVYIYIFIYIYIHLYTTYMHAHTHTHVYMTVGTTQLRPCLLCARRVLLSLTKISHTYIHTYIHTYMHTYIYMYTQIYTTFMHAHTCIHDNGDYSTATMSTVCKTCAAGTYSDISYIYKRIYVYVYICIYIHMYTWQWGLLNCDHVYCV